MSSAHLTQSVAEGAVTTSFSAFGHKENKNMWRSVKLTEFKLSPLTNIKTWLNYKSFKKHKIWINISSQGDEIIAFCYSPLLADVYGMLHCIISLAASCDTKTFRGKNAFRILFSFRPIFCSVSSCNLFTPVTSVCLSLSFRLQCVLQVVCVCLSADSRLQTVSECVTVLTSMSDHQKLARRLCSQHGEAPSSVTALLLQWL